jgi:hypothetical protein
MPDMSQFKKPDSDFEKARQLHLGIQHYFTNKIQSLQVNSEEDQK